MSPFARVRQKLRRVGWQAPSSSSHPNEPEGMTALFIHDGSSVEMGGQWLQGDRLQATATIERGGLSIGALGIQRV